MQSIHLENRELPYGIKEELKMLRTNLLFCGDDKRIILLTSALSNEGKSNCSINLSRSLAELGKNVLLIDVDLRKSVLQAKIENGGALWGLSHFLSGQCGAEQIVFRSETDGFYLIPAGPYPPNPAELLSSPKMGALIQALKGQFDYIILDAPPLGMVADAAVVASNCDAALLLLEAGRVPYKLAQSVVSKLKNSGCPVQGVILNKVGRQSNGKYGGYYGRYYGGYYAAYGEYN